MTSVLGNSCRADNSIIASIFLHFMDVLFLFCLWSLPSKYCVHHLHVLANCVCVLFDAEEVAYSRFVELLQGT